MYRVWGMLKRRGKHVRIQSSIGRSKRTARVVGGLLITAVTLGLVIGSAAASLAQSAGGLPETTIAPDGGGTGVAAPAASPSGTAPASGEPSTSPTPKPIKHKTHATTKAATSYTGEVESGSGMLKLTESGWAYATPSKSGTHVQEVHAGKFVNVSGTTAHYIQIKLKSGATAYVPMTSVELAKPTDKIFRLTKDTPVLSVPNRNGKKLAEVHAGHDVQVIGTSINYMKIRMKDGLEGFIAISALE